MRWNEFVEKDKIRIQQKLPRNFLSMNKIGETESIKLYYMGSLKKKRIRQIKINTKKKKPHNWNAILRSDMLLEFSLLIFIYLHWPWFPSKYMKLSLSHYPVIRTHTVLKWPSICEFPHNKYTSRQAIAEMLLQKGHPKHLTSTHSKYINNQSSPKIPSQFHCIKKSTIYSSINKL